MALPLQIPKRLCMMAQQGGEISYSGPALEDKSDMSMQKNRELEEAVVWPWMVVVANIPAVQYKDGGDSGNELKDEWIKQGYNPIEVHLILGHSGFGVVEFGKEWNGFGFAMKFVKDFEVKKHGRKDWYDETRGKGNNIYAWIARDEDYSCSGLVGGYLRKHGDLKTVSEEMKTEISRADYHMASVMLQKEIMIEEFNMMIEDYNRGHKMLQDEANEQLKKISIEHEQTKLKLQEREMQLRARESIEESEQKMLDYEKKMNESAILEQKKVDDRMLKLADDQKREREKVHQKIIELQKKIDDKHRLELEINQMKGATEVLKCMTNEDVEAKKKFESIKEDLKEKEEELDGILKLSDDQKE